MFTKKFWLQALERMLKSAAQALLGMWALDGFDALQADYRMAAGMAAGAMILSLCLSIVSGVLPVGEADSPSLVPNPDAPAKTDPELTQVINVPRDLR